MERPGCVWTHNLLIAFTDLARILDVHHLAGLFQRPSQQSWDFVEYARPLEFDTDSLSPRDPEIDVPLARSIAAALYGEPEEPVFLTAESQPATEAVVLAIWGQQWPRLRRSFRFCTLTSKDRSTSGHRFDLQISPPGLNRASTWSRSQLSKTSANVNLETWLEICIRDLTARHHPLRDFLRRAGGDMTKGRSRFAELCELYGHVSSDKEVPAIERALEYIRYRLPPGEGRLLRKFTFEDAVQKCEFLSDRSLVTILPYLSEEFPSLTKDTARRLARRYWEIDPNILLAPTTSKYIRDEFNSIIQEITLLEAWQAMTRDENLFKVILKAKPEVLVLPQMWSGETGDNSINQLKYVRDQSIKQDILDTIVSANRSDLARTIVAELGHGFVLENLMKSAGQISETGLHFVREAAAQGPDIANIIEKYLVDAENPLPKRLIHDLIRHVQPSDVMDDPKCGRDPWVIAWTASTGELDAHSADAFHVFCVERAFSLASFTGASLLSIAFDPLFDRLACHAVSFDNRKRLSRCFDSSDWWDWSYTRGFMRAVANFAIGAGLPESKLLSITHEKQRLTELLQIIAGMKRGRRYLKSLIRDSLCTSPIWELLDNHRRGAHPLE